MTESTKTLYGTPSAEKVAGPEKGSETPTPAPERGALPPTGSVAFYIDSGPGTAFRRVAVTQHKVSYMAGYTRTADLPRVPVKDLTAAIVEATGVPETDLYRTEWSFVLPQSGRTIETRGIAGRDPFAASAETVSPVLGAVADSETKPAAKPRRAARKTA